MTKTEKPDEILKCRPIQMKATEQYFPVVLFVIVLVCGAISVFYK